MSNDTEQPLIAHLIELRKRLLLSLCGIVVATIALGVYPGPAALLDFLARPMRAHLPANTQLIAVDVFSPFVIPLKVLFLAGLVLALPWIMYQIWAFIAPGLYQHEKKLALPLIILGSILAYVGIAFVQFFVLDRVFEFVQSVAPSTVNATPDVASYVHTLLSMYVAFALAFQVPIVIILLVRFRIVALDKLKAFRRYFLILAFVIAAIATPPDVLSQFALAIPMHLLYELGLLAASWLVQPAPDAAQTSTDELQS